MSWYSKQRWEETFRIESRGNTARGFCAVVFWLWGLGGLLWIAAEFARMPPGVGVGTSAFVTAECVYWLGGLVLFGIGALINTSDYSGSRRSPEDADGDIRISE